MSQDSEESSTSKYQNRDKQLSTRSSRRTLLAATGSSFAVGAAGCLGLFGGGEDIVFWHQEGVPHRAEVFDEFAERFSDETDHSLRAEEQNWDDVYGDLTAALNAGTEPDFMFSLPAFTMTMQSEGHLVDLSDLYDRLSDDYDFEEETVRPFEYDDGLWGIPMWDMVYLHHYRSDVYDDYPPSDWDEWLSMASEATDGDSNGTVLPASQNLWTTQNLYTLMINTDAYVYGPDGGIMFDTPETVEALEFYKDMYEAASPNTSGWGWAEWEQSLFQEDALSTNGYSSWVRGLQDQDHADEWEAIEQPHPSGGQPGSVHYVNNIMVFDEERVDIVEEFLDWLMEPERYGEWLSRTEPTLYLPITEEGQNADTFWEHDLVDEHSDMVEQQIDALDNASIYGFRDIHRENDLYLPSVGELESSNVLGEIVEELIVADRSPEDAAEWGQNRIEEVLEVEASDEL